MIFLELYTLPNATGGLDEIVVDTIAAVPSFTPLILAMTFFVVWLGGMARQKLRTGTADYAMWCVVASLMTLMIALIMTMITGIISLEWLSVVVTLVIFAGVWLFLDRRQSEI